jgi:hypothetical protein
MPLGFVLLQEGGHQGISEFAVYGLACHQYTIINRADQLIYREINIGILGQFTPLGGALEGHTVDFALLPEIVSSKPFCHLGVVLGLASQCAKDRSRIRLSQKLGEIAKVGSQVTAKITTVLGYQMLDRIVEKSVHKHVGFRRPPAVDGLLPDSSSRGNALYRHGCEANLSQQVIGCFQHSLSRFRAAAIAISGMLAAT